MSLYTIYRQCAMPIASVTLISAGQVIYLSKPNSNLEAAIQSRLNGAYANVIMASISISTHAD